jgi:multidrug efflux pump
MNITQFAIEKKRVTTVALLVILFAGLSTFRTMPRAEDPGFIIRTALVQTIFPGAGPERVEQLVTDKLEKVIQEMPEIDFINSESKPGLSLIFVNIKESYKTMRPIWDNLRRKVESARSNLPEGIIGPKVNDEFGDVFGTIITITGDGYTYAELKKIADDTRNELLLIDQVAKVDIYGAQEERVFVEFNNAKLAEIGMSPYQLNQILEARNIIFPGGQIYTPDEQIVLEPSGNFESVDELKRTVIKLPGRPDVVYLGDLANIYRGYVDPPKSKMHYNGTPCLGLAISLREGGNIITLGEEVQKQIARFQQVYPIGVEFNLAAFQPYYVDLKVRDFTGNLIQAMIIVLAVMLATLGIRTGLVVASLIPMAMVTAIMVMGFFNIGLDQMSLASLIIALGMLVDNAIVMSESILVQMEEGKDAVKAAVDSAVELRIPLLTSSLTTAAAFLPIFLAESNTGEYTAPLFKVVTITLISSWVLALTMTPLLCVLFIKIKKKKEEAGFNTRFYQKYRAGLLALLRHPILTISGTLVLFFATMSLFRFVPQIFFPKNDKPIFYAALEYPVGTPLAKTEAMVREVDAFIKTAMMTNSANGANGVANKDGVVNWASFVGIGAPRYILSYSPTPQSSEIAYLIINTTSRDKLEPEFIPQLEEFCAANFPDLTIDVQPLPLGPPIKAPVQVRVSGKDIDEVFNLVDKVKAHLAAIAGTKNIRDDWGLRTKKLIVSINQPRAQRAGLSSQDIAISLQTILSGIETTDYREGDEVIPITLRSIEADRNDIGKLESHNIFVQATGRAVPLKQVADIKVVWQPAKIFRRNRLKTVTVNSDIMPGANAIALARAADQWLKTESRDWPIGYKYELGGEIESSGKSQDSINEKLPIAGLLIVLLLVWQFDSIRRPTIILLTIPLGLIGVVIGLLITQAPFGFMALLGVISLAGIVINNAIVLIDRIEIEKQNGVEPPRAIIESAQRRLRPILLTTATTVGGLIPLWLGGGPLFEAMAVAILFGLIFATVLTLGFVPTLYSIFFKVSFKKFVY